MLANQPPRPANMLNIVAINQGKRPVTMADPTPERITAESLRHDLPTAVTALDTRSPEAFGAGHIDGALNVQLTSSEFEQRAGWMLPPEGEVLLVVETPDAALLAAHKLAFVGLDRRVRGFVTHEDCRAAGIPATALRQISVSEAREQLDQHRIRIVDVREASEWARGLIPGALTMSFKQLPARLPELSLKHDEPLAVICASGMRSSTACSVLQREGFKNLSNVTGGMTAWTKAGFPTER